MSPERRKLLDLLLARVCRIDAERLVGGALLVEGVASRDIEGLGLGSADPFFATVIDRLLSQAAHLEWLAGAIERGQVVWGDDAQ